jgi:hypothetical protein
MSESIKKELIQFVADLKRADDKITWEEVAERSQEKFPKTVDISLTPNAIRKRYNAWLRESEGSKRSDNSKSQGEEITMLPQAKEELPDELANYIENYIEEYMRPVIERVSTEVAERVFQEKFSHLQKVPITTSAEPHGYAPAPPLPETVAGTRRHTVQRGKLAGTVDAELLELFESERRERGYNVSRMLDVVLWNYFGIGKPEKPRLSFELSEPSHTEE